MIDELFKKKGELVTSMELIQNQLRSVNDEIMKELEKRDTNKIGPKHKGVNKGVG